MRGVSLKVGWDRPSPRSAQEMLSCAMTQRGASKTALSVAALRAAHQLVDDEPKILDDPVAARLLDANIVEVLRAAGGGVEAPAVRALRSRVVLRSRYSEDRLAEAVRRGVRQCVILGAGLDTFAYRQPDWAAGLRVFEVDHQASQDDKRTRLRRGGVAIPPNLEFVAIDFETVSLRDGLLASALDFSQPAFFSCLGVLVYLTTEAVDAIFELVAGFPPGSEIAFTFPPPGATRSAMAERTGQAGEPWRFEIDVEGLERKLGALGFSEVDFLSPQYAGKAYFPEARADGLSAPRQTSIAAAIVG